MSTKIKYFNKNSLRICKLKNYVLISLHNINKVNYHTFKILLVLKIEISFFLNVFISYKLFLSLNFK